MTKYELKENLLKFYDVHNDDDLIFAQKRHIASLEHELIKQKRKRQQKKQLKEIVDER